MSKWTKWSETIKPAPQRIPIMLAYISKDGMQCQEVARINGNFIIVGGAFGFDKIQKCIAWKFLDDFPTELIN